MGNQMKLLRPWNVVATTPLARSLSLSLIMTSIILVGCSANPVAPGGTAPFTITELVIGTGAAATSGNTLRVSYTGWLYDSREIDNKGLQFDSSGAQGYTFRLGAGQVIAGWDQGFAGMREGGRRRLIIPSEFAYGSDGSGPIPANATLVFDVELLDVQ
jgi:FKBP-type peptidyl-prolyl cis-trans isomerase FkpA